MSKVSVSSTLTVYHDGQFWVGIIERVEDGRLQAAKVVFGAEPSNEEVLRFVVERWHGLALAASSVGAKRPKHAASPKRRLREAAKAMRQRGASTKAQMALAEERERAKSETQSRRTERMREEKRRHFEQRTEKRKQKHRGH